MSDRLPNEVEAALFRYGDERYAAGMEAGLRVAEKIVGWLTRQPDTEVQREVREWSERAIVKARGRCT